MSEHKIYCEDVLEWCKAYNGPKFHAILCDPPYELGFMGKKWDKSGIVFDPSTWAALAEHLYPGGFGMAFASSRGWHRLAVAIEDAGMRIHPSIFGWSFGSGFPKATRIDTQIDKYGGRARYEKDRQSLAAHIREKRTAEGVSVKEMASWFPYKEVTKNWERQDEGGRWPNYDDYGVLIDRLGCDTKYHDVVMEEEKRRVIAHSKNGIAGGTKQHAGEDCAWGFDEEFDVTAPATNLAKAWEGHRYGLQAMKPALEPIIVFQKPYEGKPIECIVETGAGALNIDGGRIGTETMTEGRAKQAGSTVWNGENRSGGKGSGFKSTPCDNPEKHTGRWPANFYLGDEEAARRLGEQSGERKSCKSSSMACPEGTILGGRRSQGNLPMDSGTASRFFFNVNRQIDEADPVRYMAKASRKERDAGLEEFALLTKYSRDGKGNSHEVFAHGGDEEWQKKNPCNPMRNNHPTVKPLDLCRWLATLLLPPDEYAPRRILIPFSGSGSEMIGASLAGWEEIVGIEMEEEYVEIAKARLEHWANKTEQLGLI